MCPLFVILRRIILFQAEFNFCFSHPEKGDSIWISVNMHFLQTLQIQEILPKVVNEWAIHSLGSVIF